MTARHRYVLPAVMALGAILRSVTGAPMLQIVAHAIQRLILCFLPIIIKYSNSQQIHKSKSVLRIKRIHASPSVLTKSSTLASVAIWWSMARNNATVVELPIATPRVQVEHRIIAATRIVRLKELLNARKVQPYFVIQIIDCIIAIRTLLNAALVTVRSITLNPYAAIALDSVIRLNIAMALTVSARPTSIYQMGLHVLTYQTVSVRTVSALLELYNVSILVIV